VKISLFQRADRVAVCRETVEHGSCDARASYEGWVLAGAQPNGTGVVLQDGAQALANYPHARRANGMIYVSGTSSRRPDNTHVGAKRREDGTWDLDIEEQTRAVLENIRRILQRAGADLQHLVAQTVFLVDFRDYAGFNRVYNEYFDAETGPTRTTVAVARLPHPNLLIEIQSVAVDPSASK
jgi:2-aminomuconate deaminase